MSEEKLMTFGMLCAIKREKLGYSYQEVVRRTKVTNIAKIEKGISMPRKNNIKALVDYFQITPEELAKCKDFNEKPLKFVTPKVVVVNHAKPKDGLICIIGNLIENLIKDVSALDFPEGLGSYVKYESLDYLKTAKAAIHELTILDKLL